MAVFFIGCKEDDGDKLSITTLEVSAITEIIARSGGAIQFSRETKLSYHKASAGVWIHCQQSRITYNSDVWSGFVCLFYHSAPGFWDHKTRFKRPNDKSRKFRFTLQIHHEHSSGSLRETVWIGCNDTLTVEGSELNDDGGLVEYSSTNGILKVYNTSNSGLPDNQVNVVAVQGDKVLMGTATGLTIFTP